MKDNIIKSLAKRRIGNFDPNSSQSKGDISEEVTCKVRKVKNLNIENNDFD